MKYSLTHCYTDKNKGDAAIIIATTQLIREVDKKAQISMYSTYGISDNRFETDHKIIRKYADDFFPGCFHDPQPILGFKNDKLRMFSFLWIFMKSIFLLISRNKKYLSFLLKKEEYNSVNNFLDSDVIISKGGSYLTTQNSGIRQMLSLIRMLFPFILASRYKKKIVIFSQSLGPVNGAISLWLFKKVLSKVDTIYLRESLCKEKYSSVASLCSIVPCKVIPDTAFYLQSDIQDDSPVVIDTNVTNVGFTLVDHAFKYINTSMELEEKRNRYKEAILESIKYLIDEKKATVHIFPQVRVDNSVDGHNDMKISQEVKDFFKNTEYEEYVHFYNENWTPIQLRNLYGKMNLFIGTRLHSVIFALSMYVPSINISYHGTKSQGILNGIEDYGQYVVDINTITTEDLIKKINILYLNRSDIKNKLMTNVAQIKSQLKSAMDDVCKHSNHI